MHVGAKPAQFPNPHRMLVRGTGDRREVGRFPLRGCWVSLICRAQVFFEFGDECLEVGRAEARGLPLRPQTQRVADVQIKFAGRVSGV